MRARHATERAKVFRAFPLKLNSIDLTLSPAGNLERERESNWFCNGGKKEERRRPREVSECGFHNLFIFFFVNVIL